MKARIFIDDVLMLFATHVNVSLSKSCQKVDVCVTFLLSQLIFYRFKLSKSCHNSGWLPEQKR